MIRINLLPLKKSLKLESARKEMLGFAAGLLALIGGLFVWNSSIESKIDARRSDIAQVKREIEQLKKDVVRVKDFGAKADQLQKKVDAIEALKKHKVGPAKVLDDLATILNAERKVWLTKIIEKDGVLTLEGGAMEHENVSDFTVALERRSKYFSNVRLGQVRGVSKPGADHLEWVLTCKVNYTAG